MTVGITELPPEGMQLPGVALAGDAERGTKTTEGISLLFTTAGVTVQGPQPQIERLLVWSALDSATCREKVQLPDGREAAIMELTSGGQSIRFLLPERHRLARTGRLPRPGPPDLAAPLQGHGRPGPAVPGTRVPASRRWPPAPRPKPPSPVRPVPVSDRHPGPRSRPSQRPRRRPLPMPLTGCRRRAALGTAVSPRQAVAPEQAIDPSTANGHGAGARHRTRRRPDLRPRVGPGRAHPRSSGDPAPDNGGPGRAPTMPAPPMSAPLARSDRWRPRPRPRRARTRPCRPPARTDDEAPPAAAARCPHPPCRLPPAPTPAAPPVAPRCRHLQHPRCRPRLRRRWKPRPRPRRCRHLQHPRAAPPAAPTMPAPTIQAPPRGSRRMLRTHHAGPDRPSPPGSCRSGNAAPCSETSLQPPPPPVLPGTHRYLR